LGFFLFGSALLFSVFVGCHDSSSPQLARTTGVAPTQSARPTASSIPSANAVGTLELPVASAAESATSSAAPMPSNASAGATGTGATSTGATSTGATSTGATSTDRAVDHAPALIDAQGKPLPQTDERPTLTSASFQQRVALVARAITTGDAEPASAAFFPLLAYQQVKDVAKPERDYKLRLLANFKRDVLEYHHALGAAAAEAKFDGIAVSEKDAKWMAPGSEGNRVGYFRVLRSRLRFTLPTGRTREFQLTSMISWRGEWYVVHLHGFK
jgi:hypothetical protein